MHKYLIFDHFRKTHAEKSFDTKCPAKALELAFPGLRSKRALGPHIDKTAIKM
jgi:hypothetical protein